MNKTIALAIIVAAVCSAAPSQAGATDLNVVFCQFSLSEVHLRMSGKFQLIYDFQVDADGIPSKVGAVKSFAVDDHMVESCVRQWRLTGFPTETRFRATFNWTHPVGWTSLAVEGGGLHYLLEISGDRCPYGRTPESP